MISEISFSFELNFKLVIKLNASSMFKLVTSQIFLELIFTLRAFLFNLLPKHTGQGFSEKIFSVPIPLQYSQNP